MLEGVDTTQIPPEKIKLVGVELKILGLKPDASIADLYKCDPTLETRHSDTNKVYSLEDKQKAFIRIYHAIKG